MGHRYLAGLVLTTAAELGGPCAVAQSSNARNMGTCSREFVEAHARPIFNVIMRGFAAAADAPLGAVVAYIARGEGDCRS